MKTTIKILLGLFAIIGALLISGCANPQQNQPHGFFVAQHGQLAGVQVDFAALRDDAQSDDGFWRGTAQNYAGWWRTHPWLTGAGHLGAAAGVYLIGDKAGWWGGGSGGSSTSNTGDTWGGEIGNDQVGDRMQINIRGDGNTINIENRQTTPDPIFNGGNGL